MNIPLDNDVIPQPRERNVLIRTLRCKILTDGVLQYKNTQLQVKVVQ